MRKAQALLIWVLTVGTVAAIAPGCRREGPPDVASFEPILAEDGRLVELMIEANQLALRNPHSAAETLRNQVVQRARANAQSAGRTQVQHRTAVQLRTRLCALVAERAESTEALATALDGTDPEQLSRALRRVARLANNLQVLEADVHRARN